MHRNALLKSVSFTNCFLMVGNFVFWEILSFLPKVIKNAKWWVVYLWGGGGGSGGGDPGCPCSWSYFRSPAVTPWCLPAWTVHSMYRQRDRQTDRCVLQTLLRAWETMY